MYVVGAAAPRRRVIAFDFIVFIRYSAGRMRRCVCVCVCVVCVWRWGGGGELSFLPSPPLPTGWVCRRPSISSSPSVLSREKNPRFTGGELSPKLPVVVPAPPEAAAPSFPHRAVPRKPFSSSSSSSLPPTPSVFLKMMPISRRRILPPPTGRSDSPRFRLPNSPHHRRRTYFAGGGGQNIRPSGRQFAE